MRLMICVVVPVFGLLFAGCASAPKESRMSDEPKFKRTDKFDKVWIAEAFDFRDYDSILVTPVTSAIEPKDDKGRYRLETAQKLLLKDLAHSLEMKRVVASVVMKESDL